MKGTKQKDPTSLWNLKMILSTMATHCIKIHGATLHIYLLFLFMFVLRNVDNIFS